MTRLTSDNALEIIPRLRHRRRRHRQLRHPLPRQRRLRAHRQAQRLRLDLPLRRPGQRLRHRKTARAIAACIPSRLRRAGAVLRRRRRAGILPGLVGVIQATEAIKLILGSGEPLIGRLLLVDALAMRFRELKLRKNPDCPVCGDHPTITKLIDYEQFCGIRGEEKPATATIRRHDSGRTETAPRCAATTSSCSTSASRNEYQICNLGGHLIPLNDLPTARRRTRRLARDRRPLQDGRPQRQGRRLPEASRASPTCTTWQAASTPGPSASTPRCRSTRTGNKSKFR